MAWLTQISKSGGDCWTKDGRTTSKCWRTSWILTLNLELKLSDQHLQINFHTKSKLRMEICNTNLKPKTNPNQKEIRIWTPTLKWWKPIRQLFEFSGLLWWTEYHTTCSTNTNIDWLRPKSNTMAEQRQWSYQAQATNWTRASTNSNKWTC